jgi:hypothetical protein
VGQIHDFEKVKYKAILKFLITRGAQFIGIPSPPDSPLEKSWFDFSNSEKPQKKHVVYFHP